jgi:hypothetical protein
MTSSVVELKWHGSLLEKTHPINSKVLSSCKNKSQQEAKRAPVKSGVFSPPLSPHFNIESIFPLCRFLKILWGISFQVKSLAKSQITPLFSHFLWQKTAFHLIILPIRSSDRFGPALYSFRHPAPSFQTSTFH